MANKQTQSKLSKVLNRALCIAQLADTYKPNVERYKDANILIQTRLLLSRYDEDFLKQPTRQTRMSSTTLMQDKLFIKTKYKNSIFATGTRQWNKLSSEIRKSNTKNLLDLK